MNIQNISSNVFPNVTNFYEKSQIHKYNNTKEYTIICTKLLSYLACDRSISNGAKSAFHIIYNAARFDRKFAVMLSVKELSKLLEVSIRTIQRYLKKLVSSGYLIVEDNFELSGRQTMSTYTIKLPHILSERLEMTKNRCKQCQVDDYIPHDKTVTLPHDKTVTPYNNNIMNNTNNNNKHENPVEIVVKNNKRVSYEELECIDAKNESSNALHSFSRNTTKQNYEKFINCRNSYFKKLNEVEKKKKKQSYTSDKNKKLDRTISQINIDIDNNLTKLNAVQNERDSLITQHLSCKITNTQFYLMDKQLQHKIAMLEIRIERDKALIEKVLYEKDFKKNISDPSLISRSRGNIEVTQNDMEYLYTKLRKIGFTGEKLAKLSNEIIYSVRFGNLRMSSVDGTKLSVRHAINIALKLIKNGTWQKPVGFENKVATIVESNST